MKRLVVLVGLALAEAGTALAQPSPHGDIFSGDLVSAPLQGGPVDTRFFGTYCLPAPKKFCKSIPILPDPCVTLSALRTHLDHLTTPTGGLLHGGGRLTVDGKEGSLALAGSVLGSGNLDLGPISLGGGALMRFVGVIPGLGEQLGYAVLSADGLELTATAQNRTLAVRKDACGNRAPQVTLSAPGGPTFPFGQWVMLVGHIDDEDTSFPTERTVFVSNRQGLVSGTRAAGGRTLFTTALHPGNHHVTLTFTDSGGLTGQASVDIAVVNRPPEPRILQPAPGANLATGGPVLLRGTALDHDTGFLSGGALVWTAQLASGGPFVALGSGNELTTVFSAPADPVRIRLTATDSGGAQAQIEQQVRVVAGTGNSPPVVAIRLPDPGSSNGPLVGGFLAGSPAHFLAEAWDTEDPPPNLQLRWEFVALEGLGGAPDPTPPVPNPAPVTGTLAPDVTFPVGPDAYYRVTFKATDSGGLTSSESIEIAVRAEVIE